MNEVKNNIVKVEEGESSLAIAKGYGYKNKEGKDRYSYNDTYYEENGNYLRKVSNERGQMFYNVDLIDVVIEEFPMKDGQKGSKTYPLSEVPYLAESSDNVDPEVLRNFLKFKQHR